MATAQQKTYHSPPTHYDPTQRGPLHKAHTTRNYYEPKPPKKDLKAHDAPKDDRTKIAYIAKEFDRLAGLYDKGKPVLQVPRYMRDEYALKNKLDKREKLVISDLEKRLGIDMSTVKKLTTRERRPYIVNHLSRYVANRVPEVIASQKRTSPVDLKKGQMVDTTTGQPVSKYKAPYKHQAGYKSHHPYELAAAVIGITILLLLGTSLLTGQISGAAVVTELENSSDFPYTLLVFLVVVFLFGMMWRSSRHTNFS